MSGREKIEKESGRERKRRKERAEKKKRARSEVLIRTLINLFCSDPSVANGRETLGHEESERERNW